MHESTLVGDEIVNKPIDLKARKALDKQLTVREKMMIELQKIAAERGKKEIYLTVDELATRARVHPPTAQVTLWDMEKNRKEIKIIRERNKKNGKMQIIGFELDKMVDPVKTIANGTEKAKETVKNQPAKIRTPLVHLNKYLEQKIAVGQATEILEKAGLTSEHYMLDFKVDPILEEGASLLEELAEAYARLAEARQELEGKRRTEPFAKS